jgi:hypothetical protein
MVAPDTVRLPPVYGIFSSNVTLIPALAAVRAAGRPAVPAPTIRRLVRCAAETPVATTMAASTIAVATLLLNLGFNVDTSDCDTVCTGVNVLVETSDPQFVRFFTYESTSLFDRE